MGQKGAKKMARGVLRSTREAMASPARGLNRRKRLWEHEGTEHGRARKCARRRGAVRSASQYFPQSTRVLCGKYSSTPLAMPRRPNAKPTHPFLPGSRQSRKPRLPRRSLRPHEAWEGRENNFTTTKNALDRRKPHATAFSGSAHCIPHAHAPRRRPGTQASPTRPVRARPCSRAAQNDVCRGARPFSGCGPKP